MEWIYQGHEVRPEDLEGQVAFVYRITNTINNRQYIGKKKLTTYRRVKVKGKKNRKKIIAESDWRDYYGSSNELLADISNQGRGNFYREILCFAATTGASSYLELFWQMKEEVLLHPEKYYNSIIQCRIHRTHVAKLQQIST